MTTPPTLIAEISFDGTTRVNVSAYVRSFSINQGRTRERDRMGVGQVSLVFNNRDGRFDRDKASGPYYPNVRPNRQIWLSVLLYSGLDEFTMGSSAFGGPEVYGGGTVEVPLFTGRTEGGPQSFLIGRSDAYATWSAVDDSKRLNRDRSLYGYGAGNQLTGARVNSVLDGATPMWSSDKRRVDPGVRTVQADTGSYGRYDYLLQVAESEGGVFFVAPNGDAVFRDARYAGALDTTVFGDGAGEHPYRDISIDDDDKEIYNAITVTASGQSDQVSEDTASEAEFGRADLPISSLLSNTVDMAELADGLLAAYSQPRRRIAELVLAAHDTDWYKVLTKEPLDQIVVRHRPIYGGTIEQLSVIQGRTIAAVDKYNWSMSWALSPPAPAAPDLNLLTDNQASIETDATGWTAEAYCTIARSTVTSLVGSACLEITTTNMNEVNFVKTTPYTTAPVTVGESYTATAFFSAPSVYFGAVEISWCNSGGTQLSVTTMDQVYVYPGGWTSASVTGVAPASAAYAVVRLRVVEPYTFANLHYVDAISLRKTS